MHWTILAVYRFRPSVNGSSIAGLGLVDDVMKVPERQNRGVYWNVKVRRWGTVGECQPSHSRPLVPPVISPLW